MNLVYVIAFEHLSKYILAFIIIPCLELSSFLNTLYRIDFPVSLLFFLLCVDVHLCVIFVCLFV